MKNQGNAPRSVTNELVVENQLPEGDTPPAQTTNDNTPPSVVNEPPAASVTPPAAAATPAAVVNQPPAASVTPPAVVTPPVTVVAVGAVSNALAGVFNNAMNSPNRRAVFNICDANRILPGSSTTNPSSLWSFVTKQKVTHSIDIVRQLGAVTVAKVANCTANGVVIDTSVDYAAALGNYFATAPICNRTLRRNDMNDDYIRASMTDGADLGLDMDILNGAFVGNTGLKGIIPDSGTIELAAGTSLGTALGRLLPVDLANATIILRATTWFAMLEASDMLKGCCVVFSNGVPEMRYLGVRVVPSVAIPATHYAVIGNLARYIAGYGEEASVTADTSKGFDEDKTYFKVQVEAAGGSNAVKKTVNGVEASSFVTILNPAG